jgi:hypothetical protein
MEEVALVGTSLIEEALPPPTETEPVAELAPHTNRIRNAWRMRQAVKGRTVG